MTRRILAAGLLALTLFAAPLRAEQLVVKSALVRLIERVDLASRVDGVVDQVLVKEGQRVKPGDLLAQLDDRRARVIHERTLLEIDIARQEAENDVAVRDAEEVLAVAQAEWDRAQETIRLVPGSISKSRLDYYELAVAQGKLALEKARRELDLKKAAVRVKENLAAEASETLERHKLTSPIAGIVAAVEKRTGESVTVGEQVFRVVSDDRLRVEGFLETRDYRPGLAGSPAQLRFDLDGRPPRLVPGRVVFVNPENDPHNGQIRVWIEIDNPDSEFRAGMKPDVLIELSPAAARSPAQTGAPPAQIGTQRGARIDARSPAAGSRREAP